MTRLEASFQIEPVQPYWNLGIRGPKVDRIDGYLEGTAARGLVALDDSSFLVPLDIIRFVKGRGGTTAAALGHLLSRFPKHELRHDGVQVIDPCLPSP